MEQFSLEKYLENPSRKVTTRLGNREVRIICWDRKNNNNRPIITLMIDPDGNEYVTFHTKNGFVDEKEKYIDKRDLFFADEEEELTKFEKVVQSMLNEPHFQDIEAVKQFSKTLLNLAREELEKSIEDDAIEFAKSYMEDVNPSFEKVQESEELWKWKMSCLRGINKAYTRGKQDASKSLPKWKKCDDNLPYSHIGGLNKRYLIKNGYCIKISDLETLPKEE